MKEISLRKNFLQGVSVDTIYFGGGTPSILDISEIELIMDKIKEEFFYSPSEITLEANPDDITAGKIRAWKAAGINRLSIGIQSFDQQSLSWMNRAHNAEQALASIILAKENGIENLTIDLIYGIPGLSDDQWKKNIHTAIAAGVQHLSCYALTVEPKTSLHNMIKKKKTEDIDQDQQVRQFKILMDIARENGFEHYEISNFALPGFRSKHNSSYWRGRPYLGLGPSAHSYDLQSRYWNISNNSLYIQSIHKGMVPVEKETLTISQQFNEYIMTSLRTTEGVEKNYIEHKFGTERLEMVNNKMKDFIQSGKVVDNGNAYTLTDEGKLFADGIAMEVFEL